MHRPWLAWFSARFFSFLDDGSRFDSTGLTDGRREQSTVATFLLLGTGSRAMSSFARSWRQPGIRTRIWRASEKKHKEMCIAIVDSS